MERPHSFQCHNERPSQGRSILGPPVGCLAWDRDPDGSDRKGLSSGIGCGRPLEGVDPQHCRRRADRVWHVPHLEIEDRRLDLDIADGSLRIPCLVGLVDQLPKRPRSHQRSVVSDVWFRLCQPGVRDAMRTFLYLHDSTGSRRGLFAGNIGRSSLCEAPGFDSCRSQNLLAYKEIADG
jgi:hypothetical protein